MIERQLVIDALEAQGANRILVVDDDQAILDEFVHSLRPGGADAGLGSVLDEMERELFDEITSPVPDCEFDVVTCRQGEEAVEAVRQAVAAGKPFAAAFLDIRMPPGISGAEAAKQIREIDPDLNIVIVTGTTAAGQQRDNEDLPALDRLFFFQKPFHGIECRQLASVLCENWHADRVLKRTNEILEERVAERTEELHRLAYYDEITGLPNRNGLNRKLRELLRHAPFVVGVVLLDIERFSLINETLGYDAGNELLNLVAARLKGALAKTDIVGRFGADEFTCLIDGIRDEDQLREQAQRVEQLFAAPFELRGKQLVVRASFGVAAYPGDGKEADLLLRCAESALKRSKQHLLHRIVFYRPEMGERSRRLISLEDQLTRAIARDEVKPFFQPQVSVEEGVTIGVEALARWVQPEGKQVVPPGEFIGLAEEVGLSGALFESMLRQSIGALAQCKRTLGRYVPASINVSAHELKTRNLAELVRAALETEGLPPDAVKLELTESVLMDDLEAARRLLDELRDYGVRVQIDDFGTGYSSLSYLVELPLQALKIDRSFVMKLTEQEASQRVVQAVVAMGCGLGMQIVAEGVETLEQLAFLERCGCWAVQGNLISEPLPAEKLPYWLAAEADRAGGRRPCHR